VWLELGTVALLLYAAIFLRSVKDALTALAGSYSGRAVVHLNYFYVWCQV